MKRIIKIGIQAFAGLYPSAGQNLIQEGQKDEKKDQRIISGADCSSAPDSTFCVSPGRRCMDILDLVAVALSDGNGCNACHRKAFWGFEDRGWIFSKVLAIAVTGFLTWLLVAGNPSFYSSSVCRSICGCWHLGFCCTFSCSAEDGIECYPSGKMQLIFREELLFFVFFLMWTYLAGFRPQAYGTEKFMDYGFMEAMMRSKTFLHVISGIQREPSIITMAGSILQCFLRSLQEAEWK